MKGSVHRHGSKWQYKFRSPQSDPATGQFPWITKSGFATEKDAWRACRAAMKEAEEGSAIHPTGLTIAQFFDQWFAGVQPTLDATTWQSWHDYARLYVTPRIGGVRLQQLDEPQLLKLYGALLKEGRIKPDHDSLMYARWSERIANGEDPTPREISESCGTSIHAARAAVARYKTGVVPKPRSPGLAPKTVRNIHTMIHRALADAVAWKYIRDNPASRVKPPKKPRSRRPVWNSAQAQTFLRSIADDRFAALFLLEVTTGVRRGQICGLKWPDVNLDNQQITVHDNRVVVAGRTVDKAGGKTANADQTIAIDRATVAALRRWRTLQESERKLFGRDHNTGNYVFTYEDGRPPHPDSIRQRFYRLANAAGLPQITFHDLRHSYVTIALRAGVNPKVMSERIGHSDVGYFLQTYAHVSPDDDRDAAEKAAGFVLGEVWKRDD